MSVDRLLYKPVEAAQAIRVSRSKMYVLMRSGQVPSIRVGGVLRVPVEALRLWVEQQLADRTAPRR